MGTPIWNIDRDLKSYSALKWAKCRIPSNENNLQEKIYTVLKLIFEE
jgi:hypothetical protein